MFKTPPDALATHASAGREKSLSSRARERDKQLHISQQYATIMWGDRRTRVNLAPSPSTQVRVLFIFYETRVEAVEDSYFQLGGRALTVL